MNHYQTLAIHYLKTNKRRNIITVIGVVVTTMVLFTGLNLLGNGIATQITNIREEGDYELILLTESKQQAEEILQDTRIRSAYIGPYYLYEYGEEQLYPNALYVTVTNPYRMNAVMEQICEKYGITGQYHDDLAQFYFQGNNQELVVIIVLTVLLVSYIFAIFGVGIVRNSIQLFALEHIQDYGNLRCIGASKKQLKSVIYIQGAVLELIGIGIGVALGTVVSMVIGWHFQISMGFHPLAVCFILILFMGDLYFTMVENSKLIINMTPLAAIRGEYRIRKEKLKLRKGKLFEKLFGIEGSYAYKNLMRNPTRFVRAVTAMTFGITAFMIFMGLAYSLNWYIKKMEDKAKYYQIYCESMLDVDNTPDLVHAALPSIENLQEVAQMKHITEVKQLYGTKVYLVDLNDYYSHLSDEFLQSGIGRTSGWSEYMYIVSQPADQQGALRSISQQEALRRSLSGIECYGYDEEDYQRYQSVLQEGTLNVSEHGVVIINRGDLPQWDEEDALWVNEGVTLVNYQIGDTIDIVNMKRYRSEMAAIYETIEKRFNDEMERLEKEYQNADATPEYPYREASSDLYEEFFLERRRQESECWNRLIEEGDYQTYTIEGIVKEDINHGPNIDGLHEAATFRIILPLDRYYALTGTDESMNTGIQFHYERPFKYLPFVDKEEIDKIYNNLFYDHSSSVDISNKIHFQYAHRSVSTYLVSMQWLADIQRQMCYAVMIIMFISIMAILNFINTTTSNLYLRRREFAQLRVIGTSKERLMKMVIYEGLIMTVISSVLGVLFGCGADALLYGIINQFIVALGFKATWKFHFPYVAVIISILASVLLFCGSIYIPMKNMKQDMVSDLKTGGD